MLCVIIHRKCSEDRILAGGGVPTELVSPLSGWHFKQSIVLPPTIMDCKFVAESPIKLKFSQPSDQKITEVNNEKVACGTK